jgi:hypothetical protein
VILNLKIFWLMSYLFVYLFIYFIFDWLIDFVSKFPNIHIINFKNSTFYNSQYYTYIQSRYYRAPEVILDICYCVIIVVITIIIFVNYNNIFVNTTFFLMELNCYFLLLFVFFSFPANIQIKLMCGC